MTPDERTAELAGKFGLSFASLALRAAVLEALKAQDLDSREDDRRANRCMNASDCDYFLTVDNFYAEGNNDEDGRILLLF